MWTKKTCIVAGCSRLGASLAGKLSEQGYDVIIIDKDKDSFRKLPVSFSGFQVIGDATDPDILAEASIDKAILLIAATDNDNVNGMIAQIASRIYGVNEVFARLIDVDKAESLAGTRIQPLFPLELCIREFERLSSFDFSHEEEQEDLL